MEVKQILENLRIKSLQGGCNVGVEWFGSGDEINQLSIMSLVEFSISTDIWLSTCPLLGIDLGITISNAEILSEAIITKISSLIVYTSLTLPSYLEV